MYTDPTTSFDVFYQRQPVISFHPPCLGSPRLFSPFAARTTSRCFAAFLQSIIRMVFCHFRLNSNPDLRLGDVTTVNWTIAEVQVSVYRVAITICGAVSFCFRGKRMLSLIVSLYLAWCIQRTDLSKN